MGAPSKSLIQYYCETILQPVSELAAFQISLLRAHSRENGGARFVPGISDFPGSYDESGSQVLRNNHKMTMKYPWFLSIYLS